MYLFDFFVFFTFWQCFEVLLMVLWNFVDVFSVIFSVLYEFRWFWNDLIQTSARFWCVLHMCLLLFTVPFFTSFKKNTRFRLLFLGSSTECFRRIRCFRSVTHASFRFFQCFSQYDNVFGAVLMVLWNFIDVFSVIFSGFVRVSMILERSDSDFNTVLVRSPNVFAIFYRSFLKIFSGIPLFHEAFFL